MGKLWVTVNGKRKRTAAGVKHDLGIVPLECDGVL